MAGDNNTLLDCGGFNCFAAKGDSTGASHAILSRHCCNIRGNVIAMLVFTIVALIQAGLAYIIVLVLI